MSAVSVLSPAPEKSPLKECKGMPVFFVKTLVLWLSGSEALLVGRRNDKIQRRTERGKREKKGKGYKYSSVGSSVYRSSDHLQQGLQGGL